MNILPRSFYMLDTVQAARNLIGKKLVRRIEDKLLIGIISECEAYRIDDPACHAFKGMTVRNKSLFGPVGFSYVYLSYGLHFCLNVVSRDAENFKAGGVLIRAVIPIHGIELMYKIRSKPLKILTDGPGKLTEAFSITKEHDSLDLTTQNSNLFLIDAPSIDEKYIEKTPRIGISQAKDKLWRFVLSKDFNI